MLSSFTVIHVYEYLMKTILFLSTINSFILCQSLLSSSLCYDISALCRVGKISGVVRGLNPFEVSTTKEKRWLEIQGILSVFD